MVMSFRVRPANELEAYKKYLRDHGEKLELSQVQPPPVAPESNAVNEVQKAFGMIEATAAKNPEAMQMVAPGKALIGWSQPDARGYDFTNSWEEFATVVESDRPAFELLHTVLTRPKLDFQLDYKKGVNLLLPQLAPLKLSTQKLSAACILDMHQGDTSAAVTNILTMLALVHKNAGEGLLISHLVRIALVSFAVAPTWELLQTTNVTGAQLAAVQAGWEQMDCLRDAENAFETDRAWSLELLQKCRVEGGISGMSGSGSSGGSWTWPPDWHELADNARSGVGETLWRSSWSYSDELCLLKRYQIIMEAARAMQTNHSGNFKADYDAMTARLASVDVTNEGAAFFRILTIPDFSDLFRVASLPATLRKTLRIIAARDVVVTAIALKRYQLQHGAWPETLAAMVPALLPSVPIDPYDGKPLRYHPNADGTFLLYCVGEDGVDDGGDPTCPTTSSSASFYWQNDKARDWVWPQPATPAEIQYFREHPPK